jgi:probable F420-dependent oxidoreductase
VTPVNIGSFGIWTFAFDQLPAARGQELAREVEALGYGSVWIPEAVGKDPLVHSALLLSGTTTLTVATGIANIYARDAMAMAQGHKTLTEAFPDRFLLGLGVSHAPMVEGMRGHTYAKPIETMRTYLEAMDKALYFAAEPTSVPRRCIGALGPKMCALAGDLTDGIHPYNVPPEHTAQARAIVGPDKLVAVEHAVVLGTDPAEARQAGRAHLAMYLGLPNYVNNLRRLGFSEADVADGGSDKLIDALVAHGTVEQIAARLREHLDAGADHVCIQAVGTADPLATWRELAPALAG